MVIGGPKRNSVMAIGLQNALDTGFTHSRIITTVFAERSCESNVTSAVLLENHCDNFVDAVKCDFKSLGKAAILIAGIGAAGYLGWSAWKAHRRGSRSLEASYVVDLGKEVQAHLAAEANNEIDDLVQEEVVEGEGVEAQLIARERVRRRHRTAPFLAKITNLAKNHFGGCPDSTKSNVMAVSKFVYDACKEHNCLPHQTRLIVSVVVPLVLSPDQYDLSSRALLNSPSLCQNRSIDESLRSIDGWLSNLLCHPLDARSWRRAMDVLSGLPDWRAFRLVN